MSLAYKVLKDGASCHGGVCDWSLPTPLFGDLWLPGEWMPEIAPPLELCFRGYHLTTHPQNWYEPGSTCFAVEWDDRDRVGNVSPVDNVHEDKFAVRTCRLLHPVPWDSVGVYLSGRYVISTDRPIQIAGTADVDVTESRFVTVRDSAHLNLHKRVSASAFDKSTVKVFDRAQVSAYDEAQVIATGQATVRAHGCTTILASDTASVWIYNGHVTINAMDRSIIHIYTSQVSGQITGDAVVIFYRVPHSPTLHIAPSVAVAVVDRPGFRYGTIV